MVATIGGDKHSSTAVARVPKGHLDTPVNREGRAGPVRPAGHVEAGCEPDLDAISRAVGVKPLTSLDELALDVWESDEELDAFLADLRASRESGLT